MPERHARLSASSSYRWLNCPASVSYGDGFSDSKSVYTEEGTLAHAVAERGLKTNTDDAGVLQHYALAELKARPDLYTDLRVSLSDLSLMARYVGGYVRYVRQRIQALKDEEGAMPKILVERCVSYSNVAPGGFGTTDCSIIGKKKIIVIDFKYGKGVDVEAEGNPQMSLYAVGVLCDEETTDAGSIEEIDMAIYQPRTPGKAEKEATISKQELLRWCSSIKEKAEDAYTGIGEFRAGDWCRFCKGGAVCRVRYEYYISRLKGFINGR